MSRFLMNLNLEHPKVQNKYSGTFRFPKCAFTIEGKIYDSNKYLYLSLYFPYFNHNLKILQ